MFRILLNVCGLFALLLSAFTQAHTQQVVSAAIPLKGTWTKAENGLLIAWNVTSTRSSGFHGIYVLEKTGELLVKLDVLGAVPEAEGVSIWDVSARPRALIAVGATFVRNRGTTLAAALLYFDFEGKLTAAYALEPSKEIKALALDDELDVWTVTSGSGGKPIAESFLVVEYDREGNVVREILPRSLFSPHGEFIEQNPRVGATVAGYDSGQFWFWLPSSTDLVTVRSSDGTVTSRVKTGYPQSAHGSIWPLATVRDSNGRLIQEVRLEEEGTKATASLAYYVWSPLTGSWTLSEADGCWAHRLAGVNYGQEVFISPDADTICSYRVP